ncbi:lanthionine synthetase C family protein [Priestia aryabhattai]|uniref:lanthionine synthetase C family protein n=1 Tax=Priestia aryabhattai TaxID=412384 RepID=UPI001CFD79A1|nr:lanthionine synthetase C family protein [Priestia aryabhattai]
MWKYKERNYDLLSIETSNVVLDIINSLKIQYKDSEKVISFYRDNDYDDFELCTLASGVPGICILINELEELFPNENWEQVGHQYMTYLQFLINNGNIYSISLWNGLSGVGMAVLFLSKKNQRYDKVIATINKFIINHLEEFIEDSRKKLSGNVEMYDYDVIEGLSGIGRYLLNFNSTETEKAVREILRYLVDLTKEFEYENYNIPGWYISKDNQFLENEKEEFPLGNFNLGLSHGIAGPLALLSQAYNMGIHVEEHMISIQKIVLFYKKWAEEDRAGVVWPNRLKLEELIEVNLESIALNNESWCYGIPGIINSLYLSSLATKDLELEEYSLEIVKQMMTRSDKMWSIHSPSFCHGYTGLLNTYLNFYKHTGNQEFKEGIEIVLDKIIKEYQPELTYGFLDKDHRGTREHPGLLLGTAGVLLVLISLLKEEIPDWNQVFLLS